MSNHNINILGYAVIMAVSFSLIACNGDSGMNTSYPKGVAAKTSHLNNSLNISSRSNSSNEITGTISRVSADSIVVRGNTIRVTANTIIDDSIIEKARGVEISNDLPLGRVPESLQQLLPIGLSVEVQLSNTNGLIALSIEDN